MNKYNNDNNNDMARTVSIEIVPEEIIALVYLIEK